MKEAAMRMVCKGCGEVVHEPMSFADVLCGSIAGADCGRGRSGSTCRPSIGRAT